MDDEKVEISPAVDHDHVYVDVLERVVDSVNTNEKDEEQILQSQSEPHIKPDPPEMILQPQSPKKLPMNEMRSHEIKRSKSPNKAQLDLPPESEFYDLAPQILCEKLQIDSISKINNSFSPNNNKGLKVSEEFGSPPSPYPVGDHCKSENLSPNPSISEGIDSSSQPNSTTQSRTPSTSSMANRCNQKRDPSTNNNFPSYPPPENPHFFAVEALLVPDLPSAVVVAVPLQSSTHETGSEPSNGDPASLPRNQPFWKRQASFIVAGIFFLITIAILIPILLIFVAPSNGGDPIIVPTQDYIGQGVSACEMDRWVPGAIYYLELSLWFYWLMSQ